VSAVRAVERRGATRRRLRLGMVGGGDGAFIGEVHRIAARMDDLYELVAGCFSSTPETSRASAEALRVAPERAYASFQAMARRERRLKHGIDVVAIVTPNHLHHDVAAAFLRAGIHVICDKPLTATLADAKRLVRLVERAGPVFVLTHNYTGYPMVRHARRLVADAALGKIRIVHVVYPQDWLATPIERTGTHALNLACYVTGLTLESVAADVDTFVLGRPLDDNAHVLLRFDGGAKGMLWASQVAPGHANSLAIGVYGETGSLRWEQEEPNFLHVARLGEPPRILRRGGPTVGEEAQRVTRVPAGTPEGYLEGFANIYKDAAELIWARIEEREPDPAATTLPTAADGLAAMRFVHAALTSGKRNGAWVRATA
jgi:predicted dehydrogenase